MWMRRHPMGTAVLVVVLLLGGRSAVSTVHPVPTGVPVGSQPAKVVNVVDGDTVHVEPTDDRGPLRPDSAHTIRLLAVDTPETVHPSQPEACYGQQASDFVTDVLLGETVWLEADQQDTDRYDRYLRHVWLDDGTHVNLALVERGLAGAVRYPPNDAHWARLSAAGNEARRDGAGLWGACASFNAPLVEQDPTTPRAPAGPDSRADASADCHPSYPDVCVPPAPPDLDCDDISVRRFSVRGADPHGFDGDGDGVGCAR